MNVTRRNDDDHIRRNPQDSQGKLRAGGGDLIGDEADQVDEWEELIAEEQGEFDSRIDDVGNAEAALLGGTGDLDHMHDFNRGDTQESKAAAEDNPDVGRSR
ncbi:MAG TPA: hypothetical protein VEX37_03945 [Thermomicrobiales bacterium]|nr:hypothetical protein [Thermomicrobiales bacterium]